MRTFLKENFVFLGIFIIFLVSSLSAVTYFSSENIFDAKILYVNDMKLPYYAIIDFTKKVPENLDINLEVIYKNKNLVVGSNSFICKFDNCEIKAPISKVFFGEYEILIRTRSGRKFYEQKVNFNLEKKQNDFDLIFKKNYFYKNNALVNISTLVNVYSGKNEKFVVEILPQNLPENKETFNFNCSDSCDLNFELKNNIIFGKYIVRIYSAKETLEKSFNIFLDNGLIKEETFSTIDQLPNVSSLKKKSKFFSKSKSKKKKNFIEKYDEQKDKKIITLTNYSSLENIEIEVEDIFGEKKRKNITLFAGNLELDVGIKNVKFLGNSTKLKNVKIDLTPHLQVYSDIDEIRDESNRKKTFLLLSGKTIISEEIEFEGEVFTNITQFYDSQNLSKEIVPGIGKITRILSDGTTSTFYFAYGLISINTKKPLYRENETVDLYFVVLDKNGYLYSKANVSLDVFSNGILYSYDSSQIKETIKGGLYHLNLSTNGIGKYDLNSKVIVNGIELVVSSYFNVVENYPYDIIRRVPFTIDPWQGPFENEFTITSFNNKKVYDFYEEIPKSFKIWDTNGAQIIQTKNSQLLVWRGVNTNFKPWYRSNSPLKSPDLYELGKSWIEYRTRNGTAKFYENRSWLFAIDPASTFEKGDIVKQTKTFYLNGTTISPTGVLTSYTDLDMKTPTTFGLNTIFETTAGNGNPETLYYNLTFNYTEDFVIDGDVYVTLFLCMRTQKGTPGQCKIGDRGDLQVDLLDSTGNILGSITRSNIANTGNGGSNLQKELFTFTPSATTITAGDHLVLRISSPKKDNEVYYGGVYDSNILIYTKTHISVNDIVLTNTTNETVIYKTGDTLIVKANVTDALTISDISAVNVSIKYPNGTYKISDIAMSVDTTNASWETYNYSTSIIGADPIGTYEVIVTGYEGVVEHTSRAFYSKLSTTGDAVSVVPDRTVTGNQNDVLEITHYIFNLDDTNSHSYNLEINSSYTTVLYEDNGVTALKDNDGDEIIDSGVIQAGSFKKIIAKVTVPSDAFLNSQVPVVITAKPASVNFYGAEDFESFAVDSDPTNWYDTRKNFSIIADETLFKIKSIGLNKAIGTLSTQDDIHTHYNGTSALTMKDYEITGRFYYSDSNSSLGITFLSDYPNSNQYYSLRADKTNTSVLGDGTANQFHIFSNNGGTLEGDFNSNQNAENKSWYKFRIRINDTGTKTNIKAKIWKDTASEYPFWQIETNATGGSRLTQGTVGFWTKGVGEKYLDDLRIANITIDNTVTDSVTDTIKVLSNVGENKELYLHDVSGNGGGPFELNSTAGTISNAVCIERKNGKCAGNSIYPNILTTLTLNKNPTSFFQDFYLNGTISIPLFIQPEVGKGAGGKDNIQVELYAGTTLVGTDTHIDVRTPGTTPFIEVFSLKPIIEYISANQALSLKITSGRKYFDLYFDNSTSMSKIIIPTYTYIAVQDIDVLNTTAVSKDIYDVNETMIIKINVTDPIDVLAISNVNLSIKYPNGTYAYFEVIPTLESSGTFWKFYNYTFTNTSDPGTYTFDVNAKEDNGVLGTGSTTRTVLSNVPAVSITPNRLGSTIDGVSKTYAHTVTNANGVDYDIIELNTTSTISTITLYQADGVTALTDTDGDGLLDLGYVSPGGSVNIVANVYIPGGTPVDSVDYANVTAISNTNNNVTSTITDTTTVLLANPEIKQLYLRNPTIGTDITAGNKLNVTEPTSVLGNILTLDGKNGPPPPTTMDFVMETNYSKDFKFTSDIKVKLWLIPDYQGGPACGGSDDTIKVELRTTSGTFLGSETKTKLLTADCETPQYETFTINPLVTTISAGDGLNLTLISVRRNFAVLYNNATYKSYVEMETSTFINTKSVDTYDSGGNIQNLYIYNTSYNLTFKANITDPFGAYDIKDVNITITNPNGTKIIDNVNMTLESNSTSWKFFNYTKEFIADNDIGTYTIEVSALEGNGVVSNSSNTFLFLSNGPEVKITPDGTIDAGANTTVEFTHTITNAYTESSDVADITYNISAGNVSFTDIAGSPLTDTDSDGIIDTGSIPPSGGSKLIKAIVNIPATMNPSDVITLNIIVNSSLNSSRSDFAVDTMNIVNTVPELKTLYLHNIAAPAYLNTSIPTIATPSFITVDGGGAPISFTWDQSPTFFKNFDHSGDYFIKAYIDTQGGQSDMKVELKTSSGTILGSDTKTRYATTGVQLVLFTITPPIDFIPKGEGLTVIFSELARGPYDIYVDSTYPSKIEVNTFTYISVDSIGIYNSSMSAKTLFARNDTVVLKINVSDPFTVTDIIQTNITLRYPNGTAYVNNVAMTLDQSGSDWKTYNYTITNLNTQIKGVHDITISAVERNGVIDSASNSFTIDYTPPVISNVKATPSSLSVGDNTSLSATIIDNIAVKNASIYITHPNGTQTIAPMIYGGSNKYEYNYSLATQKGSYSYFINSFDTSDNSINSSTYLFKVVGPRAVIGIEPIATSYKAGQDVNLKASIAYESSDLEAGLKGFNVSDNQTDNSTSYNYYNESGGTSYNRLSGIGFKIQIENYNGTASDNNGSTMPDLEISFYDGTSYVEAKNCDLNLEYGLEGNYAFNCSIYIINRSVTDAWATTPLNRNISIRAINMDNNGSIYDYINYSDVFIVWDTPSHVRNSGFGPLDYNLTLRVEENSTGIWSLVKEIYNQNVYIVVDENIDLTTYWNPTDWIVPEGIALGDYRVYAALLNKISGNVLVDDFGSRVSDYTNFTIDYLKIKIESPNSTVNQSPPLIDYNISLTSITQTTGGYCGYSLNSAANVSMTKINNSYFAKSSSTYNLSEGNYNVIFYCNDTANYITKISENFSYYDNKSPTVNLVYPLNNTVIHDYSLFTFNVDDDFPIINCSLYIDNILKNTTTSVTRLVDTSLGGAYGLATGNYTWDVLCTDNSTSNNIGNSSVAWKFIIDKTIPLINYKLPTPLNNSFINKSDVYINVSVNDTYFNTSWLEWDLTTNYSMTCNFVSGINNNCFYNKTAIADGVYSFKVWANDSSGNINSTNARNITIDTTIPLINFTIPTDTNNTFVNRNWSFINVSITEINLQNVTLNWNGVNESLSCSGTKPNYVCSINKTNLVDGEYNFSVSVNDSIGNFNSTETRIIFVDSTIPLINYELPTPLNNSFLNISEVYINVSVNDTYFNTSWLEWDLTTNYTMTCNFVSSINYNCFYNKTAIADGVYSFKACANDSATNSNCEKARNITVDTTIPLISYVSPTEINNTYLNRNWAFVNISITEINLANVTLNWNGTNENLPCSGTKPNYVCSVNKTGLSDGNYSFQVLVNDTIGNSNSTKTRIIFVDVTIPQIAFVYPTDNDSIFVNRSSTYINVSINESNLNLSWVEWNNQTNETMSCNFVSGINYNCFLNKTLIINGNYSYRACTNDSATNTNCTSYRNININATVPFFVVVNPLNNSLQYVHSEVWFNTSIGGSTDTIDRTWIELWNGTNYTLDYISPTYRAKAFNLSYGHYNVTFYGNTSLGNNFTAGPNLFYVSSKKGINISKKILSISNNSYNVIFNITNDGPWKNFTLYDLIDSNNFTYYNFSLAYNDSTTISGNLNGVMLLWNLTLNPLANLLITYNLNTSLSYSYLPKNYIYGID